MDKHRGCCFSLSEALCCAAGFLGVLAIIGSVATELPLVLLNWTTFTAQKSGLRQYTGVWSGCSEAIGQSRTCFWWADINCAQWPRATACRACQQVASTLLAAMTFYGVTLGLVIRSTLERHKSNDSPFHKFLTVASAALGVLASLYTAAAFGDTCMATGDVEAELACGPGLTCFLVAGGLELVAGLLNLGVRVPGSARPPRPAARLLPSRARQAGLEVAGEGPG